MSCHHILGGGLAELDVANWVFERRQLRARPAWESVLADLGVSEFELLAVRVPVDVDVGDTHGDGWDV